MTDADLARIEQSLGITLPPSYRRTMRAFPIPAAAGNSEFDVWDDADALIAYNERLRSGPHAWPTRFLAIGHRGDGSPFALDLASDEAAVRWVDHGDLENASSTPASPSWDAWSTEYFATLREEMRGEEVDPDGAPELRRASETKNAKQTVMGCVAASLLIVVIIVASKWLLLRGR